MKENKEILINWSFSDTPFTLKGEPQQHASNWSNREVFADQLGDTLFSLVTGGCHGASDCRAVSLWPDLFVPTDIITSKKANRSFPSHFIKHCKRHLSGPTVSIFYLQYSSTFTLSLQGGHVLALYRWRFFIMTSLMQIMWGQLVLLLFDFHKNNTHKQKQEVASVWTQKG